MKDGTRPCPCPDSTPEPEPSSTVVVANGWSASTRPTNPTNPTATATGRRRKAQPSSSFPSSSIGPDRFVLGAYALLLLLPLLLATLGPSRRLLVTAQGAGGGVCSSTNPKLCDRHERCGIWAIEGECRLSRSYMKAHCPASCESEFAAAAAAKATTNKKDKKDTMKAKPKRKKKDRKKKVVKKIKKMTKEEAPLAAACEDQHERCHLWARVGECTDNKSTMQAYCPKSCGFCSKGGGEAGEAVQAIVFDDDDDHFDDEDDDDDDAVRFDKDKVDDDDSLLDDDDDDDDAVDDLEDDEEEDDPIACEDMADLCTYWASVGECQANSAYMTYQCPVSCDTCDKFRERERQKAEMLKQRNLQQQNQGGASSATPIRSANSLLSAEDRDWLKRTERFGIKQVADGSQAPDTLEVIRKSVRYMESDETQSLPASILDVCENRHQFCAFWVTTGECTKNKAYMATNCAPSCQTCHLIDMETRCPPLVNPRPALGKGGLNRMFERIVRDAPGNRTSAVSLDDRRKWEEANMTAYSVVVHSSPGTTADENEDFSVATDKSRPPWVITLDGFLTPDECDALVALGHKYGYKRSEDVGERKFDGTHGSIQSDRRTSENAWCSDRDGCRQEAMAAVVHNRMSAVMGIPANHSEDLQLLKYEVGQFYKTHHDYIPHQADRQCGPRILTFFLYLSDVEAGGGTNFPHLDLTVMPKKGRALLWPSILNSNPVQKDGRMMHQALEVEAGTKYAANGWIHLYDYVTPQTNGCN